MNTRKMMTDPSLWVLIAVNGYLIYYYYHHPEVFTTLIWLYWVQSVTLGFFTFLDIITVRKVQPVTEGTTETFGRRVPTALFFLVHYGFFHLGYMIFLFTIKSSGPFQWDFFKYFSMLFFAGQLINFIRHKLQQRTQEVSLSKMFLTPYIRIVPMHLTIMAPNFLHVTHMGVFIVLKSVADVLMYLATNTVNKKNRLEEQAVLTTQQDVNL